MVFINETLALIYDQNQKFWNFSNERLVYFQAKHLKIDEEAEKSQGKLKWAEKWKLTKEKLDNLEWKAWDISASSEDLRKHINKYKERIWLEETSIKTSLKKDNLPAEIRNQLWELGTYLDTFKTDEEDCWDINDIITFLLKWINKRINKIETTVKNEKEKLPEVFDEFLTQESYRNALLWKDGEFEISSWSVFKKEDCPEWKSFGPLNFPNREEELTVWLSDIMPPEVRKVEVTDVHWNIITAIRNGYAGNFYSTSNPKRYAEILDDYNFTILENDPNIVEETRNTFITNYNSPDKFLTTEKEKIQIDWKEIPETELIYEMSLRQWIDPYLLFTLRKIWDFGPQNGSNNQLDLNKYITDLSETAKNIADCMVDFNNQFPEKEMYNKGNPPNLSIKFLAFFSTLYFPWNQDWSQEQHLSNIAKIYGEYRNLKFDTTKVKKVREEMKKNQGVDARMTRWASILDMSEEEQTYLDHFSESSKEIWKHILELKRMGIYYRTGNPNTRFENIKSAKENNKPRPIDCYDFAMYASTWKFRPPWLKWRELVTSQSKNGKSFNGGRKGYYIWPLSTSDYQQKGIDIIDKVPDGTWISTQSSSMFSWRSDHWWVKVMYDNKPTIIHFGKTIYTNTPEQFIRNTKANNRQNLAIVTQGSNPEKYFT